MQLRRTTVLSMLAFITPAALAQVPLTLSGNEAGHIIRGNNASSANFANGIFGRTSSTGGITYGVWGESASTQGRGLFGKATATSGLTYGVLGQSMSSTGRGMYGLNLHATGQTHGGYFESASIVGTGLHGRSSAATGTGKAVSGHAVSDTGYAAYFTGGRNYFENNVGFGTSDPQAALHIGGTAGVDGLMFPDGTLQTTATVAGPAGPAGTDGLQGELGPQGIQGVVGAQGVMGPQGPMGVTGATGAVGPTGLIGPTGPAGTAGENGAAGATGPAGPAGADGVAGETFWTHNSPYLTYEGRVGVNDLLPTQSLSVRALPVDDIGMGVINSNTTDVNYAMVGSCADADGYGLFAAGNSGASGTKSFRIDHPNDPTNMYLLHYSMEGPEVLNCYSGKVQLDSNGEIDIEMPEYFAKINRDPRYTLTAVGSAMPNLHIAKEISEAVLLYATTIPAGQAAPPCVFRISGGTPNGTVSWRIEGVRNDAWMRQNGAAIEVPKLGREVGQLQQPELNQK